MTETRSTCPYCGVGCGVVIESEGGQINGVTVRPGSNAAGFQASGLRPGDVIVAVNGARITSLVDVQQLQSGLAPGARLIVTVERGAQTVPIPLNLPANQ